MKLGHCLAYLAALVCFLVHGLEVETDAGQPRDHTLNLNDPKGSFRCKPPRYFANTAMQRKTRSRWHSCPHPVRNHPFDTTKKRPA
jgi:hypothetical protein